MTRTRGPIGKEASAGHRYGSLSTRLNPDSTIVVVEDERDIATFLRAYFRASGREVIHLDPTSPADVARVVAETDPVCVLLDLNLRGFHGLDAFREMRDQGASMPVIVVTADPNPRTRKAALAAGVAAFVRKPFKVNELCDLVAAHTSSGGLQGPDSLSRRLVEEVDKAADSAPVSFALVRMLRPPQRAGLSEVAQRVVEAVPAAALVARSDDGDLGVIIPGTTAEDAQAALALALEEIDDDLLVRAGVAACPGDAATDDELYMAADAALAEGCEGAALVTRAR